ncbi:MAG: DUF3488 and transglutaminase-like domain-containing protein [Planctomycetota bacterium]
MIRRRYHNAMHFAVLFGMLTYFVAAESSIIFPILACIVVGAAWWLFRDRSQSPAPRWMLNLLLLGATANMFRLAFFDPQDAITTLADYLVYLQFIKLFESRSSRDLAQLLTLNVMLVIGAVLTNVTLPVGAMILLYAPLLMGAVMLHQLYAGEQKARDAGPDAARDPKTQPQETSQRWRGDLRLTRFVAVLVILIVGCFIFFIMPRDVGESMFGSFPRASSGATVGFRDEVQLGASGFISDSPDIVLEMELFQRGEQNSIGARRYLRGAVLDEYDKEKFLWGRGERLADLDAAASSKLTFPEFNNENELAPPPRGVGGTLEQRITIRNKTTTHLFAMWRPIQVATERRGTVYLNQLDGTLRLPNTDGPITYWVRSEPDWHLRMARSAWDANSDVFREGIVNDYTRELLDRAGIVRPDTDRPVLEDERIASLIERHLRDEFTYTLQQTPPPDGVDPIDHFLTEARSGHCEYFASAMAAMCRSVGVQARVVTGYASSEIDAATGAYLVRRRHAHAWVEVRILEAVGQTELVPVWRTFDPTPPAELSALQAPPSGLLAWGRRMVDRIEQAWIMRVVTFSADDQARVLESPTASALGIDRLMQGLMDADRIDTSPIEVALRAVVTFVVVFVGVGAALLGLRALIIFAMERRDLRRGGLPPQQAALLRQVGVYPQMLRLLRKVGWAKPDWQTPLQHAALIGDVNPEASDIVRRVATLYYAARYGGRAPAPDELRRAEQDVERLPALLSSSGASS